MLDVTILAILQGVAEFLPVSSSGHLVLGKALLGMSGPGLRLDVMLHVGTLLSIAAFYFSVLRRIVCRGEWAYVLKVIVSAVPCAVVGILFTGYLSSLFNSPAAVGWGLLFTGLVLLSTRVRPRGNRDVTGLGAVIIGLAQAVAILPGVSRSGMTIAAARSMGVAAEKTAEFSFLMSVPPILGAALLEVLKSLRAAEASAVDISWVLVIYGGALSAVVGYFALKFLLRTLRGDRFWLFGFYCILVGVLALTINC